MTSHRVDRKTRLGVFGRAGQRLVCAGVIVLGSLATGVAAVAAAPLSEPLSIARSAGPLVILRDGVTVGARDAGDDPGLRVLTSGAARPLSLTTADLDEDGVADLVAGYATQEGGVVVAYRGNLGALWPEGEEAALATGGGPSTAPFLGDPRVFALPAAPELLGAGDLDADGHADVVAVAVGGSALLLLPGDGHGGLGAPRPVPVPGQVTVLAVADVNRRDGLPDVLVGLSSEAGHRLLVFEGPDGALRALPEVIAAPAAITAIAAGQLDDHYPVDIAAAAGDRLLVIHGRDRRLSQDSTSRAAVSPAQVAVRGLDFAPVALAVGELVPGTDSERELEIALLDDAGALHVVSARDGRELVEPREVSGARPGRRELLRAKTSALPTDDLLVADPDNHAVQVVMTSAAPPAPETAPWSVRVDAASEPVAVLPMRLNADGLDDLVVLTAAGIAVGATAPAATFVVNSADRNLRDQCAPRDGVCAATAWQEPGPVCKVVGGCNLAIAVAEANATAAMDAISLAVDINDEQATFTYPITVTGNGHSLANTAFTLAAGATGSAVRGCKFTGGSSFFYPAVKAQANGAIVEGNTFGPYTTAASYFMVPVLLEGAGGTVGGTAPGAGNTFIAGPTLDAGVEISGTGATGNRVLGNTIGPAAGRSGLPAHVGSRDETGEQAELAPSQALAGAGVVIANGPKNNTVGGTTAGARNTIAGGDWFGVAVVGTGSEGNLVQGNWIGLAPSGRTGLANDDSGVLLSQKASNNTIGGTTPAARNVISASRLTGISVSGNGDLTGTVIQGNYIGTDSTGRVAVPNGSDGILVYAASATAIGGTSSGARNVISGNGRRGIGLSTAQTTDTRIQGNWIGLGADGRTPLPNTGSGIYLTESSTRTLIGGLDQGVGNRIAHNLQDGVRVHSGQRHSVLGNSIYSNKLLGIDLSGDGWTRPGVTGPSGPNKYQPYPVITSIVPGESTTVVTATLTAAPGNYTVELFENWDCGAQGLIQGREPFPDQRRTVTVGASGAATFTVTLPRPTIMVTATATDAEGNTSEFSPPNIRVTDVEVTQAIQSLAEPLPLVTGKSTLVRAYIEATGCAVPGVTAQLYGGASPLTPANTAITAEVANPDEVRPSTTERSDPARSLNFYVPSDWHGQYGSAHWVLQVNPGCEKPDASCGADNVKVLDLALTQTNPVTVVMVPVHHTPSGYTPERSKYLAPDWFNGFQTYPIASVSFYRQDPPLAFAGDLQTKRGWDQLLSAIKLRQGLSATKPGPNTRFFGVVDDRVPFGPEGVGLLPGSLPGFLDPYWYAAGRTAPNYGHWIMLHELAHTFGRLHAGCRSAEEGPDPTWPESRYGRCQIGVWHPRGLFGADVGLGIKLPYSHADLMTYAMLPYGSPRRPLWVSEHTYRGLFDKLKVTDPPKNAAETQADAQEVLLVRGSINLAAGSGTIDGAFRTAEPGIGAGDGVGPFALALVSGAGATLASQAFNPTNPHLDPAVDEVSFVERMPYAAGAVRLVLTHGATTLASRTVSAHAPTVTVTYPNGGETLAGTATIRWSAADTDGGPLTFAVQYSHDAGATWRAVATDLGAQTLDLDTAALPGGTASLVRVLASDGVNTAQDASDATFSVGRKGPEAHIASPAGGARLPAGAPLFLRGLGLDAEDGALTSAALAWRDDVTGALGTGAELVLPVGLPVGQHTITLTATDSHGQTGTATASVSVVAATAAQPPAPRWLQVAARTPGLAGSQWRTGLGLLAPAGEPANVELFFHGSGGVLSTATYLPAGSQALFTDVVGDLGGSGSGALEVRADRPVDVTSRTYNLVAGNAACYPSGTFGQYYPSFSTGAALDAGDVAWLPHLTENARFRSNLAFTNSGPTSATVDVDLLGGDGAALGSFTLSIRPGQLVQETRVFQRRAGQTALERGSARVTVSAGAGVIVSASVVDNSTNDPTTLPAQAAPPEGVPAAQWVQVAARGPGLAGSQWRTDLGLLNPGGAPASAEVRFYPATGAVRSTTVPVAAGAQAILADVVGSLGGSGNGAMEVRSDAPLIVTSRTYNLVAAGAACYPGGTFGQYYGPYTTAAALQAGESARLPHLSENPAFRTNLALTNTGATRAELTVELLDGAGASLHTFSMTLDPGQYRSENQVFRRLAGQTALAAGSARVTLTSGAGVIVSASVVDNTTNDPTTIPMQR